MGIRLEQLKSQLRIGSGGVRMVGIWGLGGGGKTTLATSLYKKFSPNFDGCCFLGNIREETDRHGLKNQQEKLLLRVFGKQMQVESVELGKDKIKQILCNRKVLIVLDDVDHLDQLEALAGCCKWFGDGSRIIITTRDQHLLTIVDEIEISPISLLSHEEAVQLFNKRAYNAKKPVKDYEVLSQEVVAYAARLPLALIVLGSFLYDKDKDEWLSTLNRLKYHPDLGIVEKLKISYDGLKDVEKELFLDIACFHRRKSKDKTMKILDTCGFYPAIGVKVLIQKALITVSKDSKFDMHDLVEEMAHYIVRGKHPNNPEKHSRVWREEDIKDICFRNATMENDKIEALEYVNYDDGCLFNFIMLVSNMNKVRFLKVRTLLLKEGPSFLSNELRYINWTGYSASPFPQSFQPWKLVVLKIYNSLQKELWKSYKYLPCLKEMKLSNMKVLVRTPDFGGLPCLQKLTLKGCESLEEIHESLGNHNSLVYLSVRECKKLTRFPSIARMDKLETLEISKCIALVRTPNFGELSSLRKLDLSWCDLKDGKIHKGVGELSSLQELDLSGNYFTRLDFSLSRLTSLKLLRLSSCQSLVELPELPSSLAILRADWCKSLEAIVRDDIPVICKCLCYVSLSRGRSNPIGWERLLESMLQGMAVERGCMILGLNLGSEIPMMFEPCMVRGRISRMALPENWYNEFSGFLFFTAAEHIFYLPRPRISMKHVEKSMGDPQDDVFYYHTATRHTFYITGPSISMTHVGKSMGDSYYHTWIGYLPFSLLGDTSWWDPTSTALEVKFENDDSRYMKCGWTLVPKGRAASDAECSETTPTTHSSVNDDNYKCQLHILHDSKSDFKCKIDQP